MTGNCPRCNFPVEIVGRFGGCPLCSALISAESGELALATVEALRDWARARVAEIVSRVRGG